MLDRNEQFKMWAKGSARVAAHSFSTRLGMLPSSPVPFQTFSVDKRLQTDDGETGKKENFYMLFSRFDIPGARN